MERHTRLRLELVDGKLHGGEGLLAVRAGDGDLHARLGSRHHTDAVRHRHVPQLPALARLLDDDSYLAISHWRVCLVLGDARKGAK